MAATVSEANVRNIFTLLKIGAILMTNKYINVYNINT